MPISKMDSVSPVDFGTGCLAPSWRLLPPRAQRRSKALFLFFPWYSLHRRPFSYDLTFGFHSETFRPVLACVPLPRRPFMEFRIISILFHVQVTFPRQSECCLRKGRFIHYSSSIAYQCTRVNNHNGRNPDLTIFFPVNRVPRYLYQG